MITMKLPPRGGRLPGLCAALLTLGLISACATRTSNPGVDRELDTLVGFQTGLFTSAPQAARDENYQVVEFRAARVWPARVDGYWIYSEQQVEGTPAPYRQRIQRYFRDDAGVIRLRVYTLPDVERLIGAWREPGRLDAVAPAALNAEEGCDNLYRETPDGAYEGSTIEQECRNNWRGAAYMRSVSRVTAGGFVNWDRGFTAQGEHVWGPTGGGYEFTKLQDL